MRDINRWTENEFGKQDWWEKTDWWLIFIISAFLSGVILFILY